MTKNRTSGLSIFRPRSSALALEPRIMFDAAAAVAVDDHLADKQTTPADSTDKSVATAVDAAPSTPAARAAPTILLVVDARVADYQSLLAGLPGNVIVRVINTDESGLDVITQALDGNNAIESVQIISHGSSGSLTLGRDTINDATLSSRSTQVRNWATHLTADADPPVRADPFRFGVGYPLRDPP